MKANRLISILMSLQMHKQLTANDLVKRLEVSVKTIYYNCIRYGFVFILLLYKIPSSFELGIYF